MKRSNDVTSAILAIIIIVAAFAVSMKFLVPELNSSKTQLKQIENENTALIAKLDSLKAAKDDIASLGDLAADLDLAVPADSDAPNLITELEATAFKHNIAIPAININDEASVGEASDNTVGVNFSVSGTFEDLNSFIGSLEKDVRFMNLKSISMSQGESAITMSLQLEAYKRNVSTVNTMEVVQ